MKYLLSTAFLLVAIFLLTSCGKDEPKQKQTATATYNLSFSQDLLDACNIIITYKAENGRNVMEPVTEPWWTKSITSDKFPAKFGVMYQFSTKSDAELVKEKYDLKGSLMIRIMTTNGASYSNTVSIIDAEGVAKNKVISTLNKLSGKSIGYSVSIDGNVTPANNMDYD